jgi:hypothetical protein
MRELWKDKYTKERAGIKQKSPGLWIPGDVLILVNNDSFLVV